MKERKSSPRLQGYNYALAGYYFLTICTAGREPRFGSVQSEQMVLNAAGKVIGQSWLDLPNHYSHLALDEFIVMPNHLHAIIILQEGGGRDRFINLSLQNPSIQKSGEDGAQSSIQKDLSEIIRGFKTWSARKINELEGTTGTSVWQRSYYDHIIRDEKSLDSIRVYIRENPLKWALDAENPANFAGMS